METQIQLPSPLPTPSQEPVVTQKNVNVKVVNKYFIPKKTFEIAVYIFLALMCFLILYAIIILAVLGSEWNEQWVEKELDQLFQKTPRIELLHYTFPDISFEKLKLEMEQKRNGKKIKTKNQKQSSEATATTTSSDLPLITWFRDTPKRWKKIEEQKNNIFQNQFTPWKIHRLVNFPRYGGTLIQTYNVYLWKDFFFYCKQEELIDDFIQNLQEYHHYHFGVAETMTSRAVQDLARIRMKTISNFFAFLHYAALENIIELSNDSLESVERHTEEKTKLRIKETRAVQECERVGMEVVNFFMKQKNFALDILVLILSYSIYNSVDEWEASYLLLE